MNKVITVDVLLPRDQSKPRPTLYALDGIDAGLASGFAESDWLSETDIEKFMADKDVNVILPVGGAASYYTDWEQDDPALGRVKWETFLTKELPPIIDRQFDSNGTNAIIGLSMGATGGLALTVRNPQLYSGGAFFSACPDMGFADAQEATMATIVSRLGNPLNMWGPMFGPDWAAHNPAAHVTALRGKPIYLAVGDGTVDWSLGARGLSTPTGVVLERATNYCTRKFQTAAEAANVPMEINYRSGVHSWGYWQQDMYRSWPVLSKALGLSE